MGNRFNAVLIGVMLCVAAALQFELWSWIVEDAAISFAYARNWAEGHGLVAFAGAERVEGYSNPLWVGLLAVLHFLGFDLFETSRWLGVLFLLPTLPAVWALGRRAGAGALSVVLAGTSGSLAIWSASGLENSLYIALLAVGLARLVIESELGTSADPGRAGGRRPWSALIFLGMALTRPEGVMYAVAAGMWITAVRLVQRQPLRWLAVWWGLLIAGLALLFAVRWWYFAFPFPATYYAKLGELRPNFFDWNTRGWTQLRGWASQTSAIWMLPIMVIGSAGLKGWRGGVGMLLAGLTFGALLAPGPEFLHGIGPWPIEPPPGWEGFRWMVFGLVALVVPLLSLGRPGWKVITLCWGMTLCTLFFALRSNGDWMEGYRFLSPAAATVPVLVAVGLAQLGHALRPSPTDRAWGLRSVLAVGLLLPVWVVPNIQMVTDYKRPTSPWGVKRRLDFYKSTFERLQLDRPFLAIDHDMGGMMWWTDPSEGYVIDARGLVDLPFALHRLDREFVREYLFEQRTFDLAHAHASTGRALRRLPEFRREYVEIPGYPSGRSFHQANYLRRDLFLRADRLPEGPSAQFGPVELVGIDIPSPAVGPDSGLFIEIAVRARTPYRMLVFLVQERGEGMTVWDVPPGYDWIGPRQWRPDEAFVGRFSFAIPKDLPLGHYDLGVVVFAEDGEIIAAESPAFRPRFAQGEARWRRQVEIVSRSEMLDIAAMWREKAIETAEADACEEAEAHWERALRTRTRSTQWQNENRPMTARAIGQCWSRRAVASPDLDAVALVERARRWDPLGPHAELAGKKVAEALWPEARELRLMQDHERAFPLLDGIARANPTEAFARRWAEEARAYRFGIAIDALGVAGASPERQEELQTRRARGGQNVQVNRGAPHEGRDRVSPTDREIAEQKELEERRRVDESPERQEKIRAARARREAAAKRAEGMTDGQLRRQGAAERIRALREAR